jgi:hypothetical protein
MLVRRRLARSARILAAVLLLAVAFPAAAIAAPSPESCAAYKGVSFTAPAPAGMRTEGRHRIQWKAEFTDAYTGEFVVDDGIISEVTFDEDAPAYPSTVLIRLFRNTALLDSGEAIEVDEILPDQPAQLYVNVSWVKGDKFFTSWKMFFRYETSRNKWSDYAELAAGADTSFCVEFNDAVWRKSYGWS